MQDPSWGEIPSGNGSDRTYAVLHIWQCQHEGVSLDRLSAVGDVNLMGVKKDLLALNSDGWLAMEC
jgi:hypothetical protein